MLELLERQQSLTINQYKIFAAGVIATMLDFFDFFLISFVLAFFVRDWHLTYGQSALILLSSGVAAIPGGWVFGRLADRIGRRKVFIITVVTFSVATGLMALTPERGWIYLVAMRFIVGLGVGGMAPCSLTLVQEFVPSKKRGLIGGLTTGLLPAGPMLAALLSAFLGPVIGWRGLFAIGLLPALMGLVIQAWVPESPRWLITQGRMDDARRALAWALRIDPAAITLPAVLPPAQPPVPWRELFRYPRSIAVGCLTGLAQTGAVGLALWGVVLFVLVLRVSPAEASYLTIWVSLIAIPGRAFGAWLSDTIGRRYAGALTGLCGAATMLMAGCMHDWFIGAVSVYYLMNLAQSFFGNGNFAVIFPYMMELWPANLRASGFGLVYGTSNLGKFIGPAGLALIAGASNYLTPKATMDAIIPAFIYFAAWYLVGVAAFIGIGIETRGRTLEELDMALARPAAVKVAAR
ncbi:MAG TPA: MFS transporter [Acetobacteraceae bacterium]|nr:MFS transporter [Acetobacteraceae bacterium]